MKGAAGSPDAGKRFPFVLVGDNRSIERGPTGEKESPKKSKKLRSATQGEQKEGEEGGTQNGHGFPARGINTPRTLS